MPFSLAVITSGFTHIHYDMLHAGIVGIFNILMSNNRTPFIVGTRNENSGKLVLRSGRGFSLLNKGVLIRALGKVQDNRKVVINGSGSETVDYDIIEVANDFQDQARYRNIDVEVIGLSYRMSKDYFKSFMEMFKEDN